MGVEQKAGQIKNSEHEINFDDLDPTNVFGVMKRESLNHELLSTDEEFGLTFPMFDLRKQIEELKKKTHRTSVEDAQLAELEADYQLYVDELVGFNQRWVVNLAKKYNGLGVEWTDLWQAGNIGLLKAISKFDPNRGFRLSTYATLWIRRELQVCIVKEARNIHLPQAIVLEIVRYKTVRQRLSQRKRTDNIPSRELAAWTNSTPERINFIDGIAQDTSSLDAPVNSDPQSQTLGELIPVDDQSIEDEIILELQAEAVRDILRAIGGRDAKIIACRFGIEIEIDGEYIPPSDKGMTHNDIMAKFGINRETARRVEAIFLRKLRHTWWSSQLA